MAEDQRAGTAYWIDHYVVPTADAARFIQFYTDVFAAKPRGGDDSRPGTRFTWVGQCHVGGSPARDGKLTQGTGFPRYSWFIRKEDIPEHLARLDALGISHSEPIQTSAEGEAGTAIRFTDPDGNPLELWAPDRMPEGAMAGETAAKVGRIAAATYESRDLARTADFYRRYCGLDPLQSGQLADDTLVFPLAAAGRVIFKKVDVLGNRTLGHAMYRAIHTALVVRHDEFMPTLERLYAELPEWDFDPDNLPTLSADEADAMPPRTGMHGNPIGAEWKRVVGRADSFFDWDANCYHFVPASPIDGSMATFDFVPQEDFLEARRGMSASA
jgi:predicted enzyme related to lactoylglutathione lyase